MHNSLPHGGNFLLQIYIVSGSLIRLFIYYILRVACTGVGLRKGTLGDIAWEQRESPHHHHQSVWTLGTYKSLKDMLLLVGNQNSGKLTTQPEQVLLPQMQLTSPEQFCLWDMKIKHFMSFLKLNNHGFVRCVPISPIGGF